MAKKRSNGEGSIYPVNGKWAAAISLGRGPDGKLKRKTVYGKTQREVREKLQALQAELLAGRLVNPERMTVGEYLDTWLKDVVVHTVRPTTHESYARYVRLHITPTLGKLQLSKLQPMHLQHLYSELLSAGKSKRTVQYLNAILHRALKHAVRQRLIISNPADAVDAPRPDRKEMKVFTSGQLEQLVKAMAGDRLAPLYYLAIATGCRRGELIALRWSDVDWARPAISINRTAEEVSGGIIWTEPKTARSRRSVPLPAKAAALLKAHKARQAEEKLRLGKEYEDQGLVFARPDGRPLSPSHVSKHFTSILRKAGLPHIRLHDLRHTHATLLLAAGIHPKIVSERLGHSTITLTFDTYCHVTHTMQDAAAKRVDADLPTATLGE